MRTILCVVLIALSAVVCGCTSEHETTLSSRLTADAQTPSAQLAESLFKSDQAVLSNQEIDRILSAKVYPSAHARVAVVRIGGRYPWGRTWWSESVAQIEQQGTDRMLNAFRGSPRVGKVMVLPTMLTPAQTTVPYLREAAARVQADTLLVYRTFIQSYQQQHFFGGGDVHAYATVEAVLLDTRSGIITDTAIKTQSFSAPKTKRDLELDETIARAQQKAIAQALGQAAEELARNLVNEPIAQVHAPNTQAK
ncbi:MAG TPA: hypothetical protein VFC78_02445 [Tepidisphaeraceae bacterium]|nr:hypothetical protein [Tepidisphaeraceae bacterium]